MCCGGGGLLAGVAAYIKALRPEVKVIGVEAEDAAGKLCHALFHFFLLFACVVDLLTIVISVRVD